LEVRGLVARGGLRVSAEVAAPQFPFKAKDVMEVLWHIFREWKHAIIIYTYIAKHAKK